VLQESPKNHVAIAIKLVVSAVIAGVLVLIYGTYLWNASPTPSPWPWMLVAPMLLSAVPLCTRNPTGMLILQCVSWVCLSIVLLSFGLLTLPSWLLIGVAGGYSASALKSFRRESVS